MSTVIEHLQALRERADQLVAEGLPGHGNRQNDRSFQFHALLLVGVHLEELEKLASTAGVPTAPAPQRVVCERCLGAGIPWGSATQVCRDCDGSGFVAGGVTVPDGQVK